MKIKWKIHHRPFQPASFELGLYFASVEESLTLTASNNKHSWLWSEYIPGNRITSGKRKWCRDTARKQFNRLSEIL
jgi:hypothetical protein